VTADTAGRASVSLAAKGIHKTLGGTAVLRGVDIEAPAGSTVAVVGPSGSGKSTLLRTLNRLYEPDSGDILLDGRSVLRDDPDELRQRVGMVFQHFNLFPHLSVLANVALAPRKLRRLSADAARDLALTQLDQVGLKHKAAARPGMLSGGQQQRVAIARAGNGPAGDVLRRGDLSAGSRNGQRNSGTYRRPRRRRYDNGRRHPRNGFCPVGIRHRRFHGSRQSRGIRASR